MLCQSHRRSPIPYSSGSTLRSPPRQIHPCLEQFVVYVQKVEQRALTETKLLVIRGHHFRRSCGALFLDWQVLNSHITIVVIDDQLLFQQPAGFPFRLASLGQALGRFTLTSLVGAAAIQIVVQGQQYCAVTAQFTTTAEVFFFCILGLEVNGRMVERPFGCF